MPELRVGIAGYGVVGKAATNTLSKEYDLVIYDKYAEYDKFEDLKKLLDELGGND